MKLIGFLPDQDPTTPGIVVDCDNVIPTDNGLSGAPSEIAAIDGLAALTAQCRGSSVLMDTGGVRRHFAGTQTDLYELSSGAWVDVSRTANYAGSADSRWLFEQFGNVALATNGVEKIQSSASGVFQDVTAAPAAQIIFTTDNFVIAVNYTHTAVGAVPDGWWCSAYQDYSSWTASVTTQATSGRLIGNGGPLTAGLRLGPYAVAYKASGIFLGQYAGSPTVWQWERVPGDIGCIGREAVCDIGGSHIFIGEDNIWSYDGTRAIPLATGSVRQWFFDNSSPAYRYKSLVKFDRQKNLVWIFFPGIGETTLTEALVYNLNTRWWGHVTISIEAAVNYVAPGMTWNGLPYSTWDTMPDAPWDSQLWQGQGRDLAIFDTSHELKLLTGVSTGGSVTTGDFGDDPQVSMLRSSMPRFKVAPTSAMAHSQFKMTEGDSLTNGVPSSLSEGKFDHRQSGRFHRVIYVMTGPFELMGYQPELIPEGFR